MQRIKKVLATGEKVNTYLVSDTDEEDHIIKSKSVYLVGDEVKIIFTKLSEKWNTPYLVRIKRKQ
jgi:hypothetical protein